MFEALTLGVFEVGLSWSIVFGKRAAVRTAFRGFDVARVAAMTERDVDRLTEDASIIRNRGKIQATVDNARAMMSASPNLVALAKSYEMTGKRAPLSEADLPTSTPPPEALPRQFHPHAPPFFSPPIVHPLLLLSPAPSIVGLSVAPSPIVQIQAARYTSSGSYSIMCPLLWTTSPQTTASAHGTWKIVEPATPPWPTSISLTT